MASACASVCAGFVAGDGRRATAWKNLKSKAIDCKGFSITIRPQRIQRKTSASLSTEAPNTDVGSLKSLLKQEVSGTNRGKAATFQKRNEILRIIEELENLSPTENPIQSPLISGKWALLYTAPVDDKFVDKYAGAEEGLFLSRLKPLAFGSVTQKGSTQIIDAENGEVQNIASFVAFGVQGTLNIRGACQPAESAQAKGLTRLNVAFTSFELTLGSSKWAIPLGWINPTGWVETTFLDPDMRIGRGDKGSVFVTVRAKR